MTIDNKSDQVTNQETVPCSPIDPTQLSGRLRVAYFYGKPTAAVAATKVMALVRLPANVRILRGVLTSNAWVATSTCDVGLVPVDQNGYIDKAGTIAESATYLTGGGTLAVATAGKYEFGDTQANNTCVKLDKECYVVMKLNTAGMDGVADVVQGYVTYVQD